MKRRKGRAEKEERKGCKTERNEAKYFKTVATKKERSTNNRMKKKKEGIEAKEESITETSLVNSVKGEIIKNNEGDKREVIQTAWVD